jgi:gentisate 1,2-dioxygenase
MGSLTGSQTEAVVQEATARITDRCKEKNSYPMWTVTDKVSKLQPNPLALPTVWHWSDMREIMLDTATIVPEEMAERRALMMVNPGFRESSPTQPIYLSHFVTIFESNLTEIH